MPLLYNDHALYMRLCKSPTCYAMLGRAAHVGLELSRCRCYSQNHMLLATILFPVKREQHNRKDSWLLLKTNDACQFHARATSLLLRAVDGAVLPIRVKYTGTLKHFNSWRDTLTILITEGGLPGNTLSAKRWYYTIHPYSRSGKASTQ